jgi:hypothetical protein
MRYFYIILFSLFITKGAIAQQLPNGARFVSDNDNNASASIVSHADGDEHVTLGYCIDKAGGYLDAQNTEETEFGACVLFGKQQLKNYAGCKIDQIDFGIHDTTGRKVVVFISTTLGGQPVFKQTAKDYKAGWNQVALSTPYTITGNEDLYIGYIIYTTTELCSGIQFDYGSDFIEGVNYVVNGIGAKWSSLDKIKYNLQIRAIVTGDNLPKNYVNVSNLDAYDIITQKDTKFSFHIKNNGANVVKSVNAICEINGETKKNVTVGNMNLQNNADTTIVFDDVTISKPGNNLLSVSVDKVNGVDNLQKSNLQKRVYYTNGVSPSLRTTLVEQFSIESDDMSAKSDSVYKPVTQLDNVAWVTHHVAYETDQFTVDESKDYLRFYDSDQYYVPAVMVDRTFVNGFEDTFGPVFFASSSGLLTQIVNYMKAVPTFGELNVNNRKDEKGKLSFDVSVHSGVGEMPFQTDLRLNVFIVENNVYSTKQAGKPNGYYQNHVLRKVLTGSFGESIDLTSLDVTRNYTVDIPSSWNSDNIEIVAFLSNYNADDVNKCNVFNATMQDQSTGIDDVRAEAKPAIKSSNTEIWLEGADSEYMEINDISGRMISRCRGNIISTSGLQRGLYIVSAISHGNRITKKIMINE